MNKSVKIVLTGIDDSEVLYKAIKKRVTTQGLEGVAEVGDRNSIEIVVHGPRELVNQFVSDIDEVVIKHAIKSKIKIGFAVEPFLKEEDYREIFRFMKPDMAKNSM